MSSRTLPLDVAAAYDAARQISARSFRAACYAPWVSLFFDTLGRVRACCVNFDCVLGNIAQHRLDEIWNGAVVNRLREALLAYDFSPGCAHCHWQIADGNYSAQAAAYSPVHALKYDAFAPPVDGPWFPQNLEFNLANTCNLECVMCNGEFSSAIRSRRDRLPPLPRPYDDRFFADLRRYLPHVRSLQFLGGEPFLVAEHFRVWDLLLADGLAPACQVTTNGTIWNAQVARVLEAFPTSINVSLDGARPETLEALRRGLRHDAVWANVRRFHQYCRERGTTFGFNFTLMRQNWAELGEFLAEADSLSAPVSICTLTAPSEFSLYTLPPAELGEVVAALQREDRHRRAQLSTNRPVWCNALEVLEHRLAELPARRMPFAPRRVGETFVDLPAATPSRTAGSEPRDDGPASVEQRVVQLLRAWAPAGPVDRLVCDPEDRILSVEAAGAGFLGLGSQAAPGQSLESLHAALCARWGDRLEVRQEHAVHDQIDRTLAFSHGAGPALLVRTILLPYFEQGRSCGTIIWAAARQE